MNDTIIPRQQLESETAVEDKDAPEPGGMAPVAPPAWMAFRRRRRAAFTALVLLLVFAVILVPFAVLSIIRELILPPEAEVYFLTQEPPRQPSGSLAPQATASYLLIEVVSIDEAKGVATLRVSGHRLCAAGCGPQELVLFSLSGVEARRVGVLPSATIRVPGDTEYHTAEVELPLSGQPSLYSFDTYELVLATKVQAPQPEGPPVVVRPGDRGTPVYVALWLADKRMNMMPPKALDPGTVQLLADPAALQSVHQLRFWRPIYQPVLAVLLVIFIAAAAIHALCTQSVRDLGLSIGTLVLGVWGIRAILVSGYPPYTTAVELALSLVILILLAGIIFRVVLQLHRGEPILPK
jgi:hypothetical protein